MLRTFRQNNGFFILFCCFYEKLCSRFNVCVRDLYRCALHCFILISLNLPARNKSKIKRSSNCQKSRRRNVISKLNTKLKNKHFVCFNCLIVCSHSVFLIFRFFCLFVSFSFSILFTLIFCCFAFCYKFGF